MAVQPSEPALRHVWVRANGDYGEPTAGVVVCWQHSPVHNVNTSDWLALVVTTPFDTALLVRWVGAERLLGLADPRPADGRPAGTAAAGDAAG